jgi:CDP-paratose 2-epimerase
VTPTALITGGCGFVGTNTADRLLRDGRRVRILDDLSRPGVERNLRWLERVHGDAVEIEVADLRDAAALRRAVRGAGEIFHFAAQVAVTTSLDEPLADAGVNLNGTLALLEAARHHAPAAPLLFTSTNKVYGNLDDVRLVEGERRYEPAEQRLRRRGVSEERPLQFCTPYGCSKGAADQYVIDYAHSYRMPTAVFRMSCIYGPHQFGNEDQGWVAHFLIRAGDGAPITIYGDGKQVRDVLFVEDLVDAFLLARDRIGELAGRAFNIGGGPRNAVSLIEVLEMIGELRGAAPDVAWGDWRQGDQRYYVSDTARFRRATGWSPAVDPRAGLQRLHGWLEDERARADRAGRARAAA